MSRKTYWVIRKKSRSCFILLKWKIIIVRFSFLLTYWLFKSSCCSDFYLCIRKWSLSKALQYSWYVPPHPQLSWISLILCKIFITRIATSLILPYTQEAIVPQIIHIILTAQWRNVQTRTPIQLCGHVCNSANDTIPCLLFEFTVPFAPFQGVKWNFRVPPTWYHLVLLYLG